MLKFVFPMVSILLLWTAITSISCVEGSKPVYAWESMYELHYLVMEGDVENNNAGDIIRTPDTELSIFDDGTEVTLNAIHAFKYEFIGWQGLNESDMEGVAVSTEEQDGKTVNVAKFKMTKNRTIHAVFRPEENKTPTCKDFTIKTMPEGYVPTPGIFEYFAPSDGQANVSRVGVTLAWTWPDTDGDHLRYDVYFGSDPEHFDDTPVAEKLDVSIYHVNNILEPGTTYYWKIVAFDTGATDFINSAIESISPICADEGKTYYSFSTVIKPTVCFVKNSTTGTTELRVDESPEDTDYKDKIFVEISSTDIDRPINMTVAIKNWNDETIDEATKTALLGGLPEATRDLQADDARGDFKMRQQVLTFEPKSDVVQIPIEFTIHKDDTFEGLEAFVIEIQNVSTHADVCADTSMLTYRIVIDDKSVPEAYISLAEDEIKTSTKIKEFETDSIDVWFHLTLASNEDITVNYTTEGFGATAIKAYDYQEKTGSTKIVRGNKVSQKLTIPIIDNGTYEGDEIFFVTIDVGTAENVKLGTPNQVAITIDDEYDMPEIRYDGGFTENVKESDGSFSLDVAVVHNNNTLEYLAEPPSDLATTFCFFTVGVGTPDLYGKFKNYELSATPISDYEATYEYTQDAETGAQICTEVTITPPTVSTTLTFNLVDDALYESNEKFIIKLDDSINGTIRQPDFTVTIGDPEDLPQVRFKTPVAVTVKEHEPDDVTLTIPIVLDRASSLTITVSFIVKGSPLTTAVEGVGSDYHITSALFDEELALQDPTLYGLLFKVIFAPGETEKNAELIVYHNTPDGATDDGDLVTLDLVGAQNATLPGDSERFTLTIEDCSIAPACE